MEPMNDPNVQILKNVSRESIEIQREGPEEMASRLRQQEADAKLRRWKDGVLYTVGLISTAAILIACFWMVLNQSASPETREWARSIATLIIGGLVGYLTGKARS